MPCSAHTAERRGQARAVRPRLLRPATRRRAHRLRAKADFTDVLAEDNPDWRIDLNDDVIGRWRGENGRAGAVTLVWGRPLVRGAVAATAELDAETVDQEEISQDRFTLIALDALEGYGDELFMEVKLWSRRARSSPPRASTPPDRRLLGVGGVGGRVSLLPPLSREFVRRDTRPSPTSPLPDSKVEKTQPLFLGEIRQSRVLRSTAKAPSLCISSAK